MAPPLRAAGRSHESTDDNIATPFDAEPVQGKPFTEEELKKRREYFTRFFGAYDERAGA